MRHYSPEHLENQALKLPSFTPAALKSREGNLTWDDLQIGDLSKLDLHSPDKIAESREKKGVNVSFKGRNGFAARRRGDLIRLAAFRRENGVVFEDIDALARVVANSVVFGVGGLGTDTFRNLACTMRIEFPDDIAMRAIRSVATEYKEKGKDYWPFHPEKAGKLLDLCVIEKEERGIRTMQAIDEDDAYRAQRAADKREKERLRSQKRRDAERGHEKKRNPTPDEIKAAFGYSQATWYRKGRPELPTPVETVTPVELDAQVGVMTLAA